MTDKEPGLWLKLKQRLPWRWILLLGVLGLLVLWLSLTPEGILGKADAVGYAVCHRIDVRSFQIGDRQFSVCARCSGQYLGAILGMIYLSITAPRRVKAPPWWMIAIFVTFVVVYGVDGLNSYLHLLPGLSHFHLYEPNNTLRMLTGMGLGLGLSVALVPAFHQTVWTRIDPRPALPNFRAFAGLIGLGAGLAFLVLLENPVILYPLSLVSAASVLVLLTLVYTMVWVLLFKLENRFENLRELAWPLLAGFALALLQIAALDYVRYLLTGTWGGFYFG